MCYRQAILEKSVIGREVENTIQQGHLVKDEVVLSLVKRTLETELKDSVCFVLRLKYVKIFNVG